MGVTIDFLSKRLSSPLLRREQFNVTAPSETVRHAASVGEPVWWSLYAAQPAVIKTRERRESP